MPANCCVSVLGFSYPTVQLLSLLGYEKKFEDKEWVKEFIGDISFRSIPKIFALDPEEDADKPVVIEDEKVLENFYMFDFQHDDLIDARQHVVFIGIPLSVKYMTSSEYPPLNCVSDFDEINKIINTNLDALLKFLILKDRPGRLSVRCMTDNCACCN